MDVVSRVCLNKRRFDSQELCEQSIVANPAISVPLRAYLCTICNYWHKTKISGHLLPAHMQTRLDSEAKP